MPKTRRLSDATLVRRSQQGDRRAFGALLNRYDRRLRGLAHALLLDAGQMDAAMGMAYLRTWRDVVRVQPRDDVGPWLYRAVYNACIDQLRRAGPPRGATADDGLRGALAGLAPADRVAVVLVEREGFTAASAARILGVSEDVLTSRLDLAREHLGPAVPEPPAPVTAPAEAEAATSGSVPDGEAAEQPQGAGQAGTAAAAVAGSTRASGAAPARAVDTDPGTRPDAAEPAADDAGADDVTAGDGSDAAAGAGATAGGGTDGAEDAADAGAEAGAGATAGGGTDGAADAADDAGDEVTAGRATDDGPAGSGPDGAADGEPGDDAPGAGGDADTGASAEDSPESAPDGAAPGAAEPAGRTPDGRSTVPAEPPPDREREGGRVLQPVGRATGAGNGSAAPPGGDAPALPEGDAHLERTPDDLSEEIVIAEEDAATARRAAVRQAR